jgi:probable phosphoglycerate mutase
VLRIKAAEGDPIYERIHVEGRWDVIPGAESTEALRTRLLRGLHTIARAHPDQLVAVFVHGGVIGQILEAATGARGFAFSGADNGSISHVVVSGEQLIVRGFNDASHLIGLADAGGSQLPT